jgi:DNA-binding transcriptional LysR family regulator
MFDWNDVRCLLAVHRTGTLTRAARTLEVNQSTVSRRLATLEAELGARLVQHEADRYVLTELGRSLLARMEEMEEAAFAVQRAAEGREAQLSGNVRMTAPDAFGSRFLPQVLAEFHESYPDIDIQLVAENRTLNLFRREAELALRMIRPAQRELLVRRVGEVGNAVYASPAYLKRRGMPTPGFKDHDFIAFDETFQPGATMRWFDQHATQARRVLSCNSTHVMHSAALAGIGLAILPCYLADKDPGLTRVLKPSRVVSQSLFLVLHQDLRKTARVRALADFLTAGLKARAGMLRGDD